MENEENKTVQGINNVEPRIVRGKSKTKVAILSIVIALIVLGVVGTIVYFGVITKPVNVYRYVVQNMVDETFNTNEPVIVSDEKIGASLGLDVTLDMKQKELNENPIIKLINSIDLDLIIQVDNKEKQTVLNVDATYDKEEMLDLSVFLDAKNSKAYLYAKELLDAYLEVDMTNEQVTEDANVTFDIISEVKIKNIIMKEVSGIVTEDMCFKQDGAYVLKTTNVELISKIKTALVNLKTNQEFLNCFEDKEEIIETLNNMIELYSTEDVEVYDIEVKLYLDLFLNIKKVVLITEGKTKFDVFVDVQDESINFVANSNGENVLDGKILTAEKDDNVNMTVELNLVDIANIIIKVDATTKELDEIEKIDTKKIKRIEELSMVELINILSKLETSKLGEVITEVTSMLPTNDYEDDTSSIF